MYSRPLGSPTGRPSNAVAPLRIVKAPALPHQPGQGLHHRQQDPQQSDPTPPPSPSTPRSPQSPTHYVFPTRSMSPISTGTNSLPPSQAPPPPPTYLRALHSFRPTATSMTDSDCLSFEPDQIIQVHTLHPSGWADGTLLATNERGWFPSNYCEQYTLSNLRPLLGASSLLYATVRAKRVSHYYTVISCVVTSVRGLLVSCNALSRDTELVKTEPDVRKARKHLLSELGVLASLAKKANSMCNVEITEETELEIDALGEAIQSRTERLVNRANRLLEIATPLTELWKEEDMYIPPTPPVSGGPLDFGMSDSSGLSWEFPNTSGVKGRQMSVATTGAESMGSHSSSMSDDSMSALQGHGSMGIPNWALARLNLTHDTLLSYLAAYIGRLHLQSRSPGQIFETTNQCVIAARNFLGIVLAITTRKGNRLSSTGALEAASNSLWVKCTTLVNVAREVVSSHGVGGAEAEEDVVMDAEVKKLVEAATACVRAAGECVALGHCQLEAMGDFELPQTKVSRDSLMSLGSVGDFDRRSFTSFQSRRLSKSLPIPPLSEDNPRRPLPLPPPRTGSPTRKLPPKLNLAATSNFRTRSPTPVLNSQRSTSSLRFSAESPPGEFIKQRDAEAQAKFLVDLQKTESLESLKVKRDEQEAQINALEVPAKPEIVEPTPSSPVEVKAPELPPIQTGTLQILHPQLKRESLFRSDSDEALRLADTLLKMPRIASSSSSESSKSGEGDAVDERSMKSIPTTPEPGTPVRQVHALEWKTAPKTVTLNADGQIMGATLEGLIERMTLHDAPPDAVLSNTFYLTFRLFTTPMILADTLVQRFNIEPEENVDVAQWKKNISIPIKLRVFNVFKGWMESHWRQETDGEAIDTIIAFARGPLSVTFAQSGKRLEELAQKVSKASGPLVPRQVSMMGKTSSSAPMFVMADSPIPPAIVSRSMLTALRASGGAYSPSVTDFDPLELARQFTIRESKIFCAVLPEELVGQEFQSSKHKSCAVNVKALSSLSSIMTAWVADSIMEEQTDVKKRASIIKHWIKVCTKCKSLNNYSSMYNIFCALESTSVQRLNKTWPLISAKYKDMMDSLRHLTDVARNHAVYRAELRQRVPPCLPFMGLYLTDLTFVDEGNLNTRPVPDGPEGAAPLINFDKHIKTARIISDVQRFQIPYRLQEIPEIQNWVDAQLSRVARTGSLDSMKLYRRSLSIEPREIPNFTGETTSRRGSEDSNSQASSPLWASMSRERSSGGASKLPTVQEEKRGWSTGKI